MKQIDNLVVPTTFIQTKPEVPKTTAGSSYHKQSVERIEHCHYRPHLAEVRSRAASTFRSLDTIVEHRGCRQTNVDAGSMPRADGHMCELPRPAAVLPPWPHQPPKLPRDPGAAVLERGHATPH
jgi:hypothetical protein